jgi:hypothetical protein
LSENEEGLTCLEQDPEVKTFTKKRKRSLGKKLNEIKKLAVTDVSTESLKNSTNIPKNNQKRENSNIKNNDQSSSSKKKSNVKKSKFQKANELFDDSFLKAGNISGEISFQEFKPLIYKPAEKYTEQDYLADLKETENVYAHDFMKKNFPSNYTQINFYKNIKLVNERRKSGKQSLFISQSSLDRKDNFFLSNTLSSGGAGIPKRIWIPPPDIPDAQNAQRFNNFYSKIQQDWPYEIFQFSQECALEFLLMKNYDEEKVVDAMKNSDEFKEFLKEKRLESTLNLQTDENSNKRQRSYMLRRNPPTKNNFNC